MSFVALFMDLQIALSISVPANTTLVEPEPDIQINSSKAILLSFPKP
jgi:hypothetical protein